VLGHTEGSPKALFRGYFAGGRDLNDAEDLAARAVEADLDGWETRAYLAGDAGTRGSWRARGQLQNSAWPGCPSTCQTTATRSQALSRRRPGWRRSTSSVPSEQLRPPARFVPRLAGKMSRDRAPSERSTMSEYEQTQAISVPPDEAFAWLRDAGNLPAYLPPVTDASIEGPSKGDNPGQKVRTTLQYPGGGGSFDAEGYLAVNEGARRMEWGAEAGRDYSGWLEVTPVGAGSRVTVHLNFGERSVESELGGDSSAQDPLAQGISATLESIRRQLEEGTGKVEPPQPLENDPPTEENPAVVRDDPPPGNH
jgi:hypothetical protein